MLTAQDCLEHHKRVVQKKPLVQCITNFVSMDLMANAICAIGASPAMVHGIEEVEEFSGKASVLVVNVGTLSGQWLESMKAAVIAYNRHSKPWVLDPVAAGGTQYRTQAVLDLLKLKPAVVRGNASEITAIANGSQNTGGVDSTLDSGSAVEAAKEIAHAYDTVVAVSGKIDYITDGRRIIQVHHGVALMSLISAAGCTVTAIIAAFLVAAEDRSAMNRMKAAAYALAIFGYAAEGAVRTEEEAGKRIGPGTLRSLMLDALYFAGQDDKLLPLKIFVGP